MKKRIISTLLVLCLVLGLLPGTVWATDDTLQDSVGSLLQLRAKETRNLSFTPKNNGIYIFSFVGTDYFDNQGFGATSDYFKIADVGGSELNYIYIPISEQNYPNWDDPYLGTRANSYIVALQKGTTYSVQYHNPENNPDELVVIASPINDTYGSSSSPVEIPGATVWNNETLEYYNSYNYTDASGKLDPTKNYTNYVGHGVLNIKIAHDGWYSFGNGSQDLSDFGGEGGIWFYTRTLHPLAERNFQMNYGDDGAEYRVAASIYLVAGEYTLVISDYAITGASNELVGVHSSFAKANINVPIIFNTASTENYVTFTPTETGYYTFQVDYDNVDTFHLETLKLYNDSGEEIPGYTTSYTPYYFDDYFVSGKLSARLIAGNTYYLGIEGYGYGTVSVSAETEPDESPQITALYPANGSTFDHAATSGDKAFHITFDREVPNVSGNRPGLDFSVGTLKVHRASDNEVVYAVTESPFTAGTSSYVSLYGSSAPFTAISIEGITPELDYDTEYYVTMPEGFIKLANGAVSPAIEKGEWRFETAEEKVTKNIIETVAPSEVRGETFRHASSIKKDGKAITNEYPFYYNDSWFMKSSYGDENYQHDLVKMSLCVAMAAYDSRELHRSRNIQDLMRKIGFDHTIDGPMLPSDEAQALSNTVMYSYPEPDTDSIGYAIGMKNLKNEGGEDFTVILVAVRGGNYELEWGGNFNVGPDKTHEGFSVAADKVLTGLAGYIATNKDYFLPKVKVWVTGYSRGAATANLVAKRLDDGRITAVKILPEDIYGFCFECPRNTRESDVNKSLYQNIISIVNPIDFVTKVAMQKPTLTWGYDRYGKTLYLPYDLGGRDYPSLYNRMSGAYYYLTGEEALLEFPGQALIVDDIMKDLAKILITPYIYYLYQDAYIDAASHLVGGGTFHVEELFAFPAVLALQFRYPVTAGAFDGLAAVGTIDHAHYAELCLAWLNSLSGNYEDFAMPSYRKIFVNCPVDVTVQDSNGNVVGQISNDVVEEITDGFFAYIDDDGQKVLAFPNDEEYTIHLTATDAGAVTYTATEYNMDSGNTTRVVSYYEVDVEEGDTLTGTIENLDTTTSATYPLTLNSAELPPSIILNDLAVNEFEVSVTASGNGTVIGGGYYVTGEFAKITATANSGETFLGWYVDSTLLSSDAEYRFLVDRDIGITGKFTQNTTNPDNPIISAPAYPGGSSTTGNPTQTTHNITVPSFTGGTVTVNPASASSGNTVTLTATPDEGYALVSLTVTDSKGNELELTDKGNGKYTFTMPNSNVTVSATFAPISSEPTTPTGNTSDDETYLFPFTDVLKTDWFCSAVEYVFNNELMSGTAPYTFDPQGKMSRAMVWTVLGRMADVDVDGSVSPWYAKAREWATTNNVSDGTNPDNSISRQELMTMLWRYVGSPAATADLSKFSDSEYVADWASGAMQWAVSTGLLVGDNGCLNPASEARRCEVATIFMRFCENIVK